MAKIKLTWLLHLINIVIWYKDELFYRARVFIIPIKQSDNLKRKKVSEDKNKTEGERKQKTDEEIQLIAEGVKTTDEEKQLNAEEINITDEERLMTAECDEFFTDEKSIEVDITGETPENEPENTPENTSDIETSEEETISIFEKIGIAIEKIIEFIFNLDKKIISFINKINDIKENTSYYIDAVNDERNQAVFLLILEKIKSVLKNIKPKSVKGNIRYGTLEPYNMGQFMSIYGILYPIIYDKIQIVTENDREVIEGNITIKGRITIFILIVAFIKVYFNKDFRRMQKIFNRE